MADSGRRAPGAERGVSWFPGHMLKAQKRLAEEVKHVDVVLELRDARLPLLSANPLLEKIAAHRPRLVLLNKASLADPRATAAWSAYFTARKVPFLFLDADSGKALNLILPHVDRVTQPLLERYRARKIRPPQPRLMIAGMPNVGKSTLINRLVHSNRQKVAPMPGVTRHAIWIGLKERYQLMDTPGVMLPRIATEDDAIRLCWIGAIKDSIVGAERAALALLAFILAHRPVDIAPLTGGAATPEAALDAIGRARGLLATGGAVNLTAAAESVLHLYRSGELGRYTFELPPGR
jgi:ribosome biogenesis GTPase A